MWGKHHNFLHKTLWIATMFPRMFFLNYSCQFYWEKHCNFSHKTPWNVDCYSVYPHRFFCYDFFKKLSFFYFIFSITITRKTKSCGKNIITFLTKHYGLLQCFFIFFFVMIFFKIILIDFIFLILR